MSIANKVIATPKIPSLKASSRAVSLSIAYSIDPCLHSRATSRSMPSNKQPKYPLTGGCPCGAVRYSISTMPISIYACHCTDCQRQSGGSFALNMPVETSSFSLTRGVVKAWQPDNPSGVASSSWFCSDCSGRIYGSRVSRPERVNVRAGTLDDTTWVWPVAHLFMRSAQPWETISSDALTFETIPEDFRVVALAFRARFAQTPQ